MSTRITSYLIGAQNHTGYQQLFHETVTDGTGNLIQKIVYTIGHEHISQTTFTPNGPTQGETAVFHFDSHGTTPSGPAVCPASVGLVPPSEIPSTATVRLRSETVYDVS